MTQQSVPLLVSSPVGQLRQVEHPDLGVADALLRAAASPVTEWGLFYRPLPPGLPRWWWNLDTATLQQINPLF